VSRSDPRRALIVALGAVVAAGGLFFLVVALSGEGEQVQLGGSDVEFEVGDAAVLAAAIERDNTPLLFQDPAGGRRPIWVQHVGADPAEGWLAFDAQVGGCALEWDAGAGQFVDCDGARYPGDGEGLPQYEVRVEDGDVIVDLVVDEDTTTTSITRTGG
jgi:hypothetical protein